MRCMVSCYVRLWYDISARVKRQGRGGGRDYGVLADEVKYAGLLMIVAIAKLGTFLTNPC